MSQQKRQPVSKYERLSYLLSAYGNGLMDEAQFWSRMKLSGYSQEDIDAWCAEYHSKG